MHLSLETNTLLFLQDIYLTTHWLRTWAVLQKSSSQEVVVTTSRYLAQVAKEFFTRAHGSRSSLRIDSHWCALNFLLVFYVELCAFWQRLGEFQDVLSPRCNSVEINKASRLKKRDNFGTVYISFSTLPKKMMDVVVIVFAWF